MQRKALQYGITIDVGEFPGKDTDSDSTVADSDPTRATRLTAHAIARIGDRIPLTRKLNRHLEGTENRAGLASDLMALGADLAQRNSDVLTERLDAKLSTLGDDLKAQRAARAAAKANQP